MTGRTCHRVRPDAAASTASPADLEMQRSSEPAQLPAWPDVTQPPDVSGSSPSIGPKRSSPHSPALGVECIVAEPAVSAVLFLYRHVLGI